jgi:hypothetical protein
MNPLSRTNFNSLLATAAMCSVEAATADVGAPAGDTAAAAAESERKRALPTNFLPIVRGRLPLIFVHAIRFDKVLNAMSNKDLAVKFATSVGKIFDIKKGRNFGYVTEGFKPTTEDVTTAEAWIAQVGAANTKGQTAQGDKNLMQKTLDDYKGRGLASAEEAAAFAAARTATRSAATPAAGTTQSSALPASGETTQSNAGSADDLLK